MSVSINGTGSITGLSVGGLPDGSVDADSIAAGAVTDAKIGAGAVTNAKLGTGIDAAKLADGSVTSTELQHISTLSSNAQTQISGVGGGKILQVKISPALTGTYRTTTSQTLADVTGFTVSITPSATSSKIAVMLSGSTRTALTTANWAAGSVIAVLRDSTALGGFTVFRDEPSTGDVFTYGRCFSASFLDEPSSTSSLIYKVQFAKYQNYSGMTVYIPAINGTNDLNHCRIIVMEVGV